MPHPTSILLALSCVLLTAPAMGLAQGVPADTGAKVRGVNPADNVTKIEILPKLTILDDAGGTSITNLTFKYDRAIKGRYGINVELPVGRFESPSGADNGLGDLFVRGRAQKSWGGWTGIAALEASVPTASANTLGTGQWQLNPVLVGVRAFSPQVFTALVAKHFFSVAGDEARDDIRQGLYRVLIAQASPKGWWLLLDPQLYVDYNRDARSSLIVEVEAGTMAGGTTGIWIRGGGMVAGGWDRQQWGVSGGVRFISF